MNHEHLTHLNLSAVSKLCPLGPQDKIESPKGDQTPPRGGSDPLILYLISPRKTELLAEKPVLRWNAVPNATGYRVRLRSPAGVIWEEKVSGTEVVYSFDLMAKAIETLETFVKQGKPTAAVYHLLGDCYRQVRLNIGEP